MVVGSPEIRPMEPELIAQIKAGEVIERPASVVKELVENAVDAGASRIRVETELGGASLIRVIDDGEGIDPDSLELAFVEHTSSKLHSASELDGITTLGFRGEALYSIANVARVEAISGLRGSQTAQSVIIDHGRLVASEPAAAAGGTRFSVRDLFAQVPARRKHLRSARSESAAIHQVVAQYAIAQPAIAISLYADSRAVLASPGSGRIEDAFASVYGPDLADKTIPLRHDGPISVSGLVSPPAVSRPNRSAIHIFVNGRPVKSAALTFAVEDAMSGLLMIGRHPLAAVTINLPPDQVDPNAHPTKQEVRFVADRPVFSAVRSAVAGAMDRTVEVAEAAWNVPARPMPAETMSFLPEPERRPYPEGIRFEDPAGPPPPAPTFSQALPRLRVFGQAAQTFIVAEGPEGLYMIDQHAAHERVIFDSLREKSGERVRQPLLEPASLQLGPGQIDALESHASDLDTLGIDVEFFGGDLCRVRAVPLVAGRSMDPLLVADVLDAIAAARSPDHVIDEALTVVACKAAVKAGDTLTMTEMKELVSALEKTPNPRTCPHGRPTTIHISTERLEREFGRR